MPSEGEHNDVFQLDCSTCAKVAEWATRRRLVYQYWRRGNRFATLKRPKARGPWAFAIKAVHDYLARGRKGAFAPTLTAAKGWVISCNAAMGEYMSKHPACKACEILLGPGHVEVNDSFEYCSTHTEADLPRRWVSD